MTESDQKDPQPDDLRIDVKATQLNRRQLFKTAAAAAVVPAALLLERQAHAAPKLGPSIENNPKLAPAQKVPLSPESLAKAPKVSKNLMRRLNKKVKDKDWVASFVKSPQNAMTQAGFNPKTEFTRFDASSFNNIIKDHALNAVTVCGSVGCIVCGSVGGDV